MNENVHYLHPPPTAIAHFLRIGSSGHHQLEHLLSAGKLPPKRYVVNAGSFKWQNHLIKALQEVAEIVLDTNVAELSSIGRYQGAFQGAPWALSDRPLNEKDYVAGTNLSVIEPIPRFVVANRVDAVMAPTHLIEDVRSPWLAIDVDACQALRVALDHEGDRHIPIDYPLITTYALMRDPISVNRIVQRFHDLPIENLWLRVSGHGADATPTGIRKYIAAASNFQRLEKPIIADHLGGFAALAFVAFATGSGFAHGAGGKERFDAANWNKPKGKSGGIEGKRVYIPGLDRQLRVSAMNSLFEHARSARSILGCTDHRCCGDIETMLRNPEAHQLKQRDIQITDLSRTPITQRPDRLLNEHLSNAVRTARRASKIRVGDEKIAKVLKNAWKRLDNMQEVLSNLHETLGDPQQLLECKLRGRAASQKSQVHHRL